MSLANVLYDMTYSDQDNLKHIFDGCGIDNADYRDSGFVFTYHLEEQVEEAISLVNEFLAKTNHLTLNLYGFSRGGAAVLWICKKLASITPDKLTINVAAFEPVPGNFVIGVYADQYSRIKHSLSSKIRDLTDCPNLKSALVLFTHQPLSHIAANAPILPAFPQACQLVVDVIPGCHKGAERYIKNPYQIQAANQESALTYHQIHRFLSQSGTPFLKVALDNSLRLTNQQLLSLSQEFKCSLFTRTSRSMHFANVIYHNPDKRFLNRFHQQLAQVPFDNTQCALTVLEPNPKPDVDSITRSIETSSDSCESSTSLTWLANLFSSSPPSTSSDKAFLRPN